MKRFAILPLALLCWGCASTIEGSSADVNAGLTPASTNGQTKLGPFTWFYIASYMRRCHGPSSPDGALWAAAASALGVVYFFRKGPPSQTSGVEGRQRATVLMDHGYKGRYREFNPPGACRATVRLIINYYRRESLAERRQMSGLVRAALRSDHAGRTFLALMKSRRYVGQRRPGQQRRRIRRAILKPSEQQLPIGN
ncbi:MAG: hypothetical protein RLT05_07245 [Bauldia litoralis]